ncbi:hypothetical protein A3G65_03935 [Candidatus Roizmanbacteria bacterium RIFCSPLOWO2_12_FULL_37_7b]|nr:MAG: hypothetical protein A3E10_04005 [Candidatus Roizmanbacteria bacterium RIFCSPHIGHO2_12_FULL_37_23]OGK61250.1 MAG: hypothetical protein A3G65_03935 [Candidatus Roizmanbacteria bacterium RIFCSPLOWO2_12_FULL_37_7b]
MRKNRKKIYPKVTGAHILLILLILLLISIFYFIPPTNMLVILSAIILISTIVFTVLDFFTGKKLSFLVSFTCGTILLLNTLQILDPINIIILGSLLASISLLLFHK